MKEMIDLSKEINDLSIAGKAIVKSQKKGDSILTGSSPVGIYYEGVAVPHELTSYIGKNEVYLTMWQSKGKIKIFVSPD